MTATSADKFCVLVIEFPRNRAKQHHSRHTSKSILSRETNANELKFIHTLIYPIAWVKDKIQISKLVFTMHNELALTLFTFQMSFQNAFIKIYIHNYV